MFREKCSNGNDASQRMQFAEEIACVRPGCRSGHALSAALLPVRPSDPRQIQYRELRSVMQVDDIYEGTHISKQSEAHAVFLSLLSGNVLSGSVQIRRFYKFISSDLAIL